MQIPFLCHSFKKANFARRTFKARELSVDYRESSDNFKPSMVQRLKIKLVIHKFARLVEGTCTCVNHNVHTSTHNKKCSVWISKCAIKKVVYALLRSVGEHARGERRKRSQEAAEKLFMAYGSRKKKAKKSPALGFFNSR